MICEAFLNYEESVAVPRQRILRDEKISRILGKGVSGKLIHAFMIYFSALGVEITRPVDQWIERAGERCRDLGYGDLASMLMKHSVHERGHHTMLERDLGYLIRLWNESHSQKLNIEIFSSLPPTSATRRYINIHESVISGEKPFCQLAIEYEIESMSLALGPPLIKICNDALGLGPARGLSFIHDHSVLDVGHTAMNKAQLNKFLDQHPEESEAMSRAGSKALNIYLDFLGECVELAEIQVGEVG